MKNIYFMEKINLCSWNVNGVRAILKKNFLADVKKLNPDILCLQETKINENFLEEGLLDMKYKYYNFADKKGYSGVCCFSKIKPISVFYGAENFNLEVCKSEGRVITLEFENFFLVNVYTPNSKQELERLSFRKNVWDKNFLEYMKFLEKKKGVVVCGDLNVAHTEIDLKNPNSNKTTEKNPGNPGFTNAERFGFQNFLDSDFLDTYRFLNPKKIQYTWWSYRFNSRARNIGWRLDYFLVSKNLKKNLIEAKIYDEVLGSDHCPCGLEIEV